MFTWIPIYTELAKNILAYRNRQSELIDMLKELDKQGVPAGSTVDNDQNGAEIPLTVIDPFTFFSCFNRFLTKENKRRMLDYFKKKFDLQSEVPSDFEGIPVVNNQSAWFFPWASVREADDIPSLWALAEAVVNNQPEQLDPKLFERCLQINSVGLTKLTMGMFWLNPLRYIACDKNNLELFKKAGINDKVKTLTDYLQLIKDVNSKLGTNYAEISRRAWEHKGPSPLQPSPPGEERYWWLNANPRIWGLAKDPVGTRQSYTSQNEKGNKRRVYKYFQEARPGDLLVGYVTSPDREITGICKITKGLHESSEGECIEFEKIERLLNPVPFESLQRDLVLRNSEPLITTRAACFDLLPKNMEGFAV